MLFLCLAILSSCAIALLMRISANKISAKMRMLCANYVVCSFLGAAIGFPNFFSAFTQRVFLAILSAP